MSPIALAWGALVLAWIARGPRARPARINLFVSDARTTAANTAARGSRRFYLQSARRKARLQRAEVARAAPELIDLLALAVNSGLNVRLALFAAGRRLAVGVVSQALSDLEAEVRAGARLADAIERLPRLLGEPVRPLATALLDSERYGAAIAPALERLANEARTARHRAAEEAARKVPVKLLFPLVTCILPAFGLLTVAPLIAAGLKAVRL